MSRKPKLPTMNLPAKIGSVSTNSASTSNESPKQWVYISQKELAAWIIGWKCTMSGCQPEHAKVSEATFYLLKCGHRVCKTCRDRKITNMGESKTASHSCCNMSHKLKEMKELNEASYINSYRDQLKQKGIPCTTCKERHQEVRYYPRELMYVCLREKCSDVMYKTVEYDIYSNTSHVSLATDGEGTESDIKLTRVCLYCKSDGEHSHMDVVNNEAELKKSSGSNGEDDKRVQSPADFAHLFNECILERIDEVEGLKATMKANFDKELPKLERDPWHLAMLNRSFMNKLSKEMLTCDYCQNPFNSSNHDGSMRHKQLACTKCTGKRELCSGKKCKINHTTNQYGFVVFPRLYELDFTSERNISREKYQECDYCHRVHSVEYLRLFKDKENKTSWCCLECMYKDRSIDLLRKQFFAEKLKIKENNSQSEQAPQ